MTIDQSRQTWWEVEENMPTTEDPGNLTGNREKPETQKIMLKELTKLIIHFPKGNYKSKGKKDTWACNHCPEVIDISPKTARNRTDYKIKRHTQESHVNIRGASIFFTDKEDNTSEFTGNNIKSTSNWTTASQPTTHNEIPKNIPSNAEKVIKCSVQMSEEEKRKLMCTLCRRILQGKRNVNKSPQPHCVMATHIENWHITSEYQYIIRDEVNNTGSYLLDRHSNDACLLKIDVTQPEN